MTRPYPFLRFIVALSPLVVLTLTGCNAMKKLPFVGKSSDKKDTAQAATPAPVKATPAPPQIDYAKVRPNELGYIPVMMYHDIGTKQPKVDHGLVRSVADFNQDLELMYKAGFRPVNMGDVMSGKIDVPAGMTPVVITFDDARESQFRLTETDNAMKVDPNCGVGLLQAFNKKHPDWALKATFFALPKGPHTSDSFGQVGLGDQKLQYLVDHGFEVGNHTMNHKNMRRMTPAQIQQEVGSAHNALMASAPNAKISVLALPMGVYPHNKADWKYLVSGTYEGKSYSYDGAMLAAYRPIPSPLAKDFDPLRMERISPMDHDPNGLRSWIANWKKKVAMMKGENVPYISDGDPNTVSFPKADAKYANMTKIKDSNLLANAYTPFGGEGGAKPIIADGDEPSAGGNKPIVADAPAAGASASPAPVAQKPIQ